jgi:hypothetical protein
MNVPASRIARSGAATWFAVTGGIGAWILHVTFAASVVRLLCDYPGWTWTLHAATGVTAAITIVAMGMSAALVRLSSEPESADTLSGQLRFLGLLGLMIGAINLALILLEGSYAIVLQPCD